LSIGTYAPKTEGAAVHEQSISLAYICPRWPSSAVANGIVMYIEAITAGLRSRGHKTTLMEEVADSDGLYDLTNFTESGNVLGRVFDRLERRVRPRRSLERRSCRSIIAACRRAIRERGVQLLEIEESFGWSLPLQRALPIPLVVRLHGPWFLNGAVKNVSNDRQFHKRVRAEGKAIAEAAWITSSSRDVLEQTRAYYNMPLERAEVIHPPAPRIAAEDRWRSEGRDPQLLLFVGRFDRHKGGDLVIDAFARVAQRYPEVRLKFAGPDHGVVDDHGRSWKILDYIQERLPDARVRDRVEWLNHLPNSAVMELRKKAAISVVGSRYDNFPTTVTEAIAMGCPVVAPRVGGIPEQITDRVNGLLCEPMNPEDLAAKIGELLDNPALAAQLGARARLDCEARLSVEAISARMAGLGLR